MQQGNLMYVQQSRKSSDAFIALPSNSCYILQLPCASLRISCHSSSALLLAMSVAHVTQCVDALCTEFVTLDLYST